MINRKNIENFDFQLLLAIILISVIGIAIIYSASASKHGTYYLVMQSIWLIVGLFVMAVVIFFDYRDFKGIVYLIYGANLALLLFVIFFGASSKGAQRWIDLGFFRLQPSEFAKVAVIITLAWLMSRDDIKTDSIFDLVKPGVHVGIPMALIFLQPDLGTSLVFVAITLAMVFVAGLKWKHLLLLGSAGSAVAFLGFHFVLQDYQKVRLIVFRDPYKYALGAGFQIIQSKIAIGSGGIWGKGFRAGTQSDLNFVPEAHTDFVFSVIGEQFGLIGSAIVLILFLFIIYRVIHIAMESSDAFGTYICVGVAALLAFQVLVNVGMTLSIMPVTGLPLPFITYGGSTFMSTMLAMGLVLNVGLRRDSKTIF